MLGLVGRKIGMSRIFQEDDGIAIPVTVIQILPNYITQIKNLKSDGYHAIQVTTGSKKNKKLIKSESGCFTKYKVKIGYGVWEFRVKHHNNMQVGQIMNVDFFLDFKLVDITGLSKGKGFAGTVKRWNFNMQDASHGNSLSHRAPGSIGQNQTPGKVFKGKKMAGHLGNKQVTIQNLYIINIDKQRNLLSIKGAIPGFIGRTVIVKPSIKKYSHVL